MSDVKPNPMSQEAPASSPQGLSRVRTVLFSAVWALVAGLAASLCATLVMGLLRVLAGIPTPVELFGDYVLKHINVDQFIRLLMTYGPNAKTAPLGQALLAMIGIGTALGCLYALLVRIKLPTRGYRPGRREWLVALVFALLMTLAGAALFWKELPQNFHGWPFDMARNLSILGLLCDFVVYGVVLCLGYRALLPKYAAPNTDRVVAQRRQLLARSGVMALGVGAGLGTFGAAQRFLGDYTAYDGMKTAFPDHVDYPITPNNEHYVVTQNPVDPSVNINLWRLEVGGLVNKPGTYTYEELQKLPSTARAITLECIANGPGGHLMGNAVWHGVPLRTLIEQHGGTQVGAKYVAFYCADGYNISLPLQEVLEVDSLLAWNMNGVDLPRRHGYPLRVLIPGRYGEENPKWLTRVEFVGDFVPGLYSSQGWYNGPLHTTSRFNQPYKESVIHAGQRVPMVGIAFAGNRGIQRVEVSVDGGTTWKEATLDPPLSKDSWVFWRMNWQPTTPGTYTLAVRATDGTGEVQTGRKQGTVPNGSTGYHVVTATVK
ncbi:molybdopterin-dependent oxidoreductase [Dictyobacter formicarum]|uniref:Oxidoreductase n=1 Tax=Dictyobacter formicarum TaxID=2778368 RepID=A0ABQ3VPT2_9CHLR|nr:molybdopterin-dependent oxidoreductase [Dictyobacter formicarum]GHO87853.1 putative oxidoreductase [Dictyobacter formicarum]